MPELDASTTDLLGVLAYGELTAFERLASDAQYAPTVKDKAALGTMAVAEFGHFQRLSPRGSSQREQARKYHACEKSAGDGGSHGPSPNQPEAYKPPRAVPGNPIHGSCAE